MLPFVNIDQYLVPCGPRSIAGSLYNAGLTATRLVYQLWNPNLKPSRAQIDGANIDMLLVSSMQIHSASAYGLIQDAWTMGQDRPLIIAGGPKACYEPFDFFALGHDGNIGADVVVTGEESVLLELLTVLADFGMEQGSALAAFNRARQAGALQNIPGLVYGPDGRHDGQNLINTGIQRLLRDLDVLPMPTAGFATLEPSHRRETLAPRPLPLEKACCKRMVASLLLTRGCKYNCHYCGIPAYNQKSFRYKSPQRVVEEFIDCHRNMNTRYFFGADDNFFNVRRIAREMLEAMATRQFDGKSFARHIRFNTESTISDAYKNRDLMPLARQAGLSGLWMGVEDLAARLVDKGQTPGTTEVVFDTLIANKISPMVMLMHHEDQPLHSPGKLVGLVDQIRFLFDAGTVSLQCTIAGPAIGSKWSDEVYTGGLMYERIGGKKFVDAQHDGNHVATSLRPDPWRTQLNMLLGYAAFYNPFNFVRSMQLIDKTKKKQRRRRMAYQLWGMQACLRTAWKLKGHLWRLWRGPIQRVTDWRPQFRRPGSPYPGLIDANLSKTTLQKDLPVPLAGMCIQKQDTQAKTQSIAK